MSQFDRVSVEWTERVLAEDPLAFRIVRLGGPYPHNWSMLPRRDVPSVEHLEANRVVAIDDSNRPTLVSVEIHAYRLETLEDRTATYQHDRLHKIIRSAFPCGHPYTSENTYREDGRRRCRACKLARATSWQRRNPERHAAHSRAYRARIRGTHAGAAR